MLEKLKDTLVRHREEYIGNLKGLIACDTHLLGHGIEGGLEKNGQHYLESLLLSLGAEVAIEPMDEAVVQLGISLCGEGNPGHDYTDRYNVIGTFRGSDQGRTILFDSHVDTLPPGDPALWEKDPFEPVLKDGKLYGLGASDMKSGLMASIMSVKLLKDAGIELPGTVKILSVVDEHGGGNGTLAAVLNGHAADAAVICEPSDEMINIAHMGFLFFKISVKGRGLHSGLKWKGVNAIEKAMLLIAELQELERGWLMNYKHPDLPAPTLNIGEIRGGIAGSVVPDACEFKLCVHYLPGLMCRKSVEEEVAGAIRLRSQGDPWLRDHPPEISVYQAGGSFEMERDHPLIHTARRSMGLVFGEAVAVTGSSAGCDARLLKNVGNIPTVMMGPGHNEQCGKPNEYVTVDNYLNFILVYALTILDWCGNGEAAW
ncbi:M20 family metallopeptidase [Cohnella caldifontis]|uniref:M20 family metallopeptidase n=1 Tax=Cohnella caldifontis TaxID=3027471 RepID=UPI0023EAB0F4|nr:ArgE/DapE family deacylase [Cohnella sp. YIM B05605]